MWCTVAGLMHDVFTLLRFSFTASCEHRLVCSGRFFEAQTWWRIKHVMLQQVPRGAERQSITVNDEQWLLLFRADHRNHKDKQQLTQSPLWLTEVIQSVFPRLWWSRNQQQIQRQRSSGCLNLESLTGMNLSVETTAGSELRVDDFKSVQTWCHVLPYLSLSPVSEELSLSDTTTDQWAEVNKTCRHKTRRSASATSPDAAAAPAGW